MILKRSIRMLVIALLLWGGSMVPAAGEDGAAPADPPVVPVANDADPNLRKITPSPGSLRVADDSPTADVIPIVAEELYQRGYQHGFAGLRTDYETRSISVLWSGEVSEDIRAYAESSPLGVRVVIEEAATLTRQAVDAGLQRLFETSILPDLGAVGVDVADDYSGITIELAGQTDPTAEVRAEIERIVGFSQVAFSFGHKPATGYAN